jgi:hypothetical protein
MSNKDLDFDSLSVGAAIGVFVTVALLYSAPIRAIIREFKRALEAHKAEVAQKPAKADRPAVEA